MIDLFGGEFPARRGHHLEAVLFQAATFLCISRYRSELGPPEACLSSVQDDRIPMIQVQLERLRT